MFTPTLDWGNELWASLRWVAKAWVIAAIATLLICVLLARYTVWGRQFWRITGDYFKGPESVKVWVWLGAILLSVMIGVRLSVLFSYQGNDMMTSFQVVASGLRRRQRRREELRQGRLLAVDDRLLGSGRPVRRTDHAGPVHGAAVHAGVARMADRPTHRRLARRQGLLPRPIHRRHDRQPRSAHPIRHRHLHRRRRADCRTHRTTRPPPRCCSARSTPSPR